MRSLLFLFLLFPLTASAASTITFDPQDFSAGPGSPFVIGVNLTSDDGVNALAVDLVLPEALEPVEVSNGNSVIVLWLKQPTYNEATRRLSFEGLIPGGYAGTDGRLLTLTVLPKGSGIGALTLAPESRAYAKAGQAVSLAAESLLLPVSPGRENIENELPDADPPEAFIPEIVRDPRLYQGRATLVFSTTDKGSGIVRYDVKESLFGNLFPGLGWRAAESPYPLTNPWRIAHVYVRAVDREGNVAVAHIPPTVDVFGVGIGLLITAVLGLLIYVVRARRAS